jgi:hypothetical protein
MKQAAAGVMLAFAFIGVGVGVIAAADYESMARSVTDQIAAQDFDKVFAQFDEKTDRAGRRIQIN